MLKNIYSLYGVSTYIANSDGEILEQYGDIVMEDSVAFDKSLLARLLNVCQDVGTACIFLEGPKVFYCVFKTEEWLFVCGPMCTAFLTEKEKAQYQKKHGICIEGYSIPKVEKTKICSVLNLIRIMGGNISCKWDEKGESEKREKEMEVYDYRYRKFQSDQKHVSYEIEKKWIDAVKTGNWEMMNKISLSNSLYDVGIMADDEYKQAEYTVVVTVALLTRAAIEEGIDPVKAYEVSDLYLQKIEKSKTVQQLYSISEEATFSFSSLIQDGKRTVFYGYVQQCKNYVSAHYQENIKVNTIAEHIGLDASYLGRIFKESEGITIKEYIRQEKMKVAANMLKYSDVSIAQISDYLSYHSKSYFGELFLKTFQMTPHNYRKTYKSVNFR